MSPHFKSHLQLHFCVVLWGFTAILGALIHLPATALVFWRMWIVAFALACIPRVAKGLWKLPRRLWGIYSGIGVLVALHWLSFYGAIKLANASIAAACLGVAAAFVAFIEPMLTRTRFERRRLWLGLAVIPGVALVAQGILPEQRLGLLAGILSAFFVALFGTLNKRYGSAADAAVVSAVEMGAGAAFLTVLLPLLPHQGASFPIPDQHDIVLLLLLSLVCTALPFTLAVHALRGMSAFSAQLAVNLEPVYAVALAALLLGDTRQLTPLFYVGVAILLAAVFLSPMLERKPAALIVPP